MAIGLMGAMPPEIEHVIRDVRADEVSESGMRTYHAGELWGERVVVTLSRVGKVAAAATALHLILEHDVGEIIFTGVAGALDPSLKVGDIVVASELIQHDLDARPLFPRYEAPLLGRSRFEIEPERIRSAKLAAEWFLRDGLAGAVRPSDRERFGLTSPKVATGLVASGDRFITSEEARDALRSELPEAACVEMEGAAVAQVCYEHGIPLTVVRTISDGADDGAPGDFSAFMERVASEYSRGVVRQLLSARRR